MFRFDAPRHGLHGLHGLHGPYTPTFDAPITTAAHHESVPCSKST
jgi:hypothetical protein